MRTSILAAALLVGAWTMPVVDQTLPSATVALSAMAVEQQPSAQPQPSQPPPAPAPEPSQPAAQPTPNEPPPPVNVEVTQRGWVPTPTWVAIGVIGAVLLVVIIVMASRTGSNTVIRG
jgi:glucose/arabinose dehydrogenase